MKTLIVTGGFLDMEFALPYVKQQKFDYFIASDRGIHFFAATGMPVNEIVGDFDSADKMELHAFQKNTDILFHAYQPQKDETDTELALQLAIKRGSTEIHILGGTGTRLDHVLGTVHLLGLALQQGIQCFLIDAHNRIRLIGKGSTVLKKEGQYGYYISLLPLTTKVCGVTLTGFQYPLHDGTLETFHALGVSNEIVAQEAVITIEEGIAVLAETKD